MPRPGGLVHAPEHLTDEEAATLPCAALTVWQALVTEGRLKAGETVLVQGTGGVSIFALQFAVMFGARSIVTSSSDAKLEKAKKLGATHTINYVKTPVWHPEVRRLNGGRGIDHVIEVGGPDSFMQSLQAIRLGGQIHMIGYVGSKTGEINPLEILYRRAVVRGIPIGSREVLRAHEPRHRVASDAAGGRPRVPLDGSSRRTPIHARGQTLRQDRAQILMPARCAAMMRNVVSERVSPEAEPAAVHKIEITQQAIGISLRRRGRVQPFPTLEAQKDGAAGGRHADRLPGAGGGRRDSDGAQYRAEHQSLGRRLAPGRRHGRLDYLHLRSRRRARLDDLLQLHHHRRGRRSVPPGVRRGTA